MDCGSELGEHIDLSCDQYQKELKYTIKNNKFYINNRYYGVIVFFDEKELHVICKRDNNYMYNRKLILRKNDSKANNN